MGHVLKYLVGSNFNQPVYNEPGIKPGSFLILTDDFDFHDIH